MTYRFGDFSFDADRLHSRRADASVGAKPRVLEFLRFPIERRDRLDTKSEIFDTLWDGRIVSESALTTTITELRKTLGYTGKSGDVIRTFYGRGFGFVCDLG